MIDVLCILNFMISYNMQIKRLYKNDNLDEINLLFKELFINEMNYDTSLLESPNNFFDNKIGIEGTILLTIWDKNIAIGFLYGQILNTPNYCYKNGLGSLELLYIKDSYRKNGLATKLILEFEKWLKSQNIYNYEVCCYNKNDPAINLYKTNDFKYLKSTFRKIIKND